jgi:prepilin-type N-terminal cleavage/methylation domain-containing protein
MRGVTLIEVMIVITIMGFIASAVAISVTYQMRKAQRQATIINAKTLRQIAATWRLDHASDECPTVENLRQAHLIDPSAKMTDAWDGPLAIACDGEETSVSSMGPDRKPNTDDDIREPDPDHGKVASQ